MIAMPLYHFGSSFTFHAAAVVTSSFALTQVAGRANTTTYLATCSLAGCAANSFLVYCAANESAVNTLTNTVVSVPALTWTTRRTSQAASSGDTLVATAPFAAGGNITASYTFDNGSICSATLYEFASATVGISGSATSQTTASVTVTTQAANSYLVMVTSDWNALTGSATLKDSAVMRFQSWITGVYTAYHYSKFTTAAGSYTEGMNFPTGQSAGTCVLEVKSS